MTLACWMVLYLSLYLICHVIVILQMNWMEEFMNGPILIEEYQYTEFSVFNANYVSK